MKIACIFPGQGSQSVGMSADFYQQFAKSHEIFDKIDKIAGRPLSQLCFTGPAEALKRTINTQPAILAASIVAWEAYLQAGGPKPAFVAGHSLGEFSALYAAQVLPLESVVEAVEKRAQLMEACPPGAMSAILNMKYERLKEICAEIIASEQDIPAVGDTDLAENTASTTKVVVVANFNTEEQLVISGDPQSVMAAGAQAKSEGAKVIPLAVGGAFHSSLMNEAAKQFASELENYAFIDAAFPVVQNVTAQAEKNGTAIKKILQKQMISSVLWYDTIKFMIAQSVTHFVEIGPGKALSGMIKRIDKTVTVYNIEDSASLNNTIAALKAVAYAPECAS